MSKGCVYLIAAEGNYTGIYKIGKANDPHKRIRQFTYMPFGIRLVHTINCENPLLVESALHGFFKDCRSNGEWFALTSDQVDMIASCSDETGLFQLIRPNTDEPSDDFEKVPTTPAGHTPLMTRLPDHLLAALREEAKKNVRSLNSQMIVVLSERYGVPVEPPTKTSQADHSAG